MPGRVLPESVPVSSDSGDGHTHRMIEDGAEYLDDDEDQEYIRIARGMLAKPSRARGPGGAGVRGSRRLNPDLADFGARYSRQVNVKLAIEDFGALKELAAKQDLPTATLARMLLRNAIREERRAGTKGGG